VRKVVHLLAGAAAAAGLVLAGVTYAAAAPIAAAAPGAMAVPAATAGPVKNYDGLCLDIPGGSGSSGVAAAQETCNGSPHQNWLGIYESSSGYYLIMNDWSDLCLSTDLNGSAGAEVKQENCNGTSKYQLWIGTPLGNGYEVLQNKGSCGFCYALHPSGNSWASGVKMYVNSGSANAYKWKSTI
jgi:Ricin-type beta-trefoil lectin domain